MPRRTVYSTGQAAQGTPDCSTGLPVPRRLINDKAAIRHARARRRASGIFFSAGTTRLLVRERRREEDDDRREQPEAGRREEVSAEVAFAAGHKDVGNRLQGFGGGDGRERRRRGKGRDHGRDRREGRGRRCNESGKELSGHFCLQNKSVRCES